MMHTKRVKIYGTLGPACREPEILEAMFREGMDGLRLNLSHTSLDKAADMIGTCREAAKRCGIRPELLIDLQGPELRIGEMKEPVRLRTGDLIGLDALPFPEIVIETLSNRPSGQEILLDDGKIQLRTETAKAGEGLVMRVVRGGLLQQKKSIALPGCQIVTPAMTDSDRNQIGKFHEYGVTAVMQPFVRNREDLIEVRGVLDQEGCQDIRLFAKIENTSGVSHLEELIPHCDEIVIARGDLGNAVDLWELPALQKRISAVCRRSNKDFMVVTQMLDSMTHRQVPTRAEVSDIFNAVLDGASSVMVTGETAAGDYPVAAIRYLARTVREAEAYLQDQTIGS